MWKCLDFRLAEERFGRFAEQIGFGGRRHVSARLGHIGHGRGDAEPERVDRFPRCRHGPLRRSAQSGRRDESEGHHATARTLPQDAPSRRINFYISFYFSLSPPFQKESRKFEVF